MKTDKKPRKTTLSDQLKQVTILSNQLKLTEMAIDAIDLLMGMVQLSRETVYMVLGEPEELKPEEANEMPPLAESLAAQIAAQNEDTDATNKPEKVEPPPRSQKGDRHLSRLRKRIFETGQTKILFARVCKRGQKKPAAGIQEKESNRGRRRGQADRRPDGTPH